MTDVEAGDGISVSSFLPIFRRCAVHHPFESLCEFPSVVVAHHPADLRNAQRLPLHEQLRRQILNLISDLEDTQNYTQRVVRRYWLLDQKWKQIFESSR